MSNEMSELEAFEDWFFCPSNSLLAEWEEVAFEAFQAGAAYQRAQQPSAGVVMPERRECDDGYPSDDWLIVSAWNACLDEFARLNGKEVGRG